MRLLRSMKAELQWKSFKVRWCQGPYVMSCSTIIITASAKRPNTMQLMSFPEGLGNASWEKSTISYTFFCWHPPDNDDFLSAVCPETRSRCCTAVLSATLWDIKRYTWQNTISLSLAVPKESQDLLNVCSLGAILLKKSSPAPDFPLQKVLQRRRGGDYKEAPSGDRPSAPPNSVQSNGATQGSLVFLDSPGVLLCFKFT